MKKKDYLLIILLTISYLFIAVLNLGDFKAPENGYTPLSINKEFVVEFYDEIDFSKVTYYCGLGDNRNAVSSMELSYLDENNEYTYLCTLEKERSDSFKWKYENIFINTSSIKFKIKLYIDESTKGIGGEFLEVAFYDMDINEPLPIKGITESIKSDANIEALFDEQDLAVYTPSLLNSTYFDEVYFTRSAYELVNDIELYENSHPPLGKIIISLGIKLFGMAPFSYRIIGTLIGALMLPLMYLFGKKLFKSSALALLCSFFLMVDFMHFVQTRIGTADGYLCIFIILMFYYMNQYFIQNTEKTKFIRSLKPLLLAGIFFGLATSVKWIGLYAGLGICLMFFTKQITDIIKYKKGSLVKDKFIRNDIIGVSIMCIVFFIVIPLGIYTLTYIPIFKLSGEGDFVNFVISTQKHMFSYHSSIVAEHPFSSEWWQWPFNIKPIWYYKAPDVSGGMWGTIASFGNPLVWLGGFASLFISGYYAFKKKDKKILFVFFAYLSILLPWTFAPRKLTFMYHYFECVPFLVISLVYSIKNLLEENEKMKKYIYIFIGLSGVLFLLYYPALSGLVVSEKYIEILRWFPGWFF